MRAYLLSVSLLAIVAFSLITTIEPWFQSWSGNRAQSDNVIQVALGDSRRMFARHFYTKADAYFHSGYYPSIYDSKEGFNENAISGEDAAHDEEKCEGEFLGKPHDWLDAFSRNFFPSRHVHLGECTDPNHHHDHAAGNDHDHEATAGLEREILPWLRLSAEMDPQRIETYTVAAFWLWTKLGKMDEAEQFLREGLRANPGDCEILFALGSIYYSGRKDVARGRNVLELALARWREQEGRKSEPNRLLLGQILNQLAKLEREQNNYPRAIEHYRLLREVTPSKQSVQEWIDYLSTNQPPAQAAPAQ